MIQIYPQNQPQVSNFDVRLDALLGALDDLHSMVSEGETLPLNDSELLNWLYEIRYTVQETIEELEVRAASSRQAVRLVLTVPAKARTKRAVNSGAGLSAGLSTGTPGAGMSEAETPPPPAPRLVPRPARR